MRRTEAFSKVKPRVAIIDDDPFIRKMWELTNPTVTVETFGSPISFWQAVHGEPELLGSLSCVVTDHFFESGAAEGIEFARKLKKLTEIPVILNSNLKLSLEELDDVFDHQTSCKTSSWRDIEGWLSL